MHRWLVGDVEIVRVDASNFVLPTGETMPHWAVPAFTASRDLAPLAFSALAIRAGDQHIVVDPWLADDAPRGRPDAAAVVASLLEALTGGGFPPDRVDVVVNTHIDGVGWNTRPSTDGWEPTFRRARYLYPADELAALDRGAWISGGDQLGPLRDADVLDTICPPSSLTEEITLVAAPGHNFGHVAVRVDHAGQLAVYPGHLVLSLLQIESPGRDVGDADLAVATTTRRRILDELADRRGLLLTTLIGGPGGGTVEREGDGFRLVPAHLPE